MARDFADELLQAQVKTRLFGGDHAPRLGRLVLLERIGTGAMGAVFAAYDPRLDRKVAVKVLHAADADANARSLREARALGKLAHPNVIAIHDAGEEDGTVHIVMELATGTPLRAWIHKERTWRDVLRVLREAARGLAAAHRAGIVHRDIKPDNIIVGDDATRVVDFGLAQTSTDETDNAGTPSYMAPEVLAGEPATTASDQFSFGVTLFEALYGERPHAGATRDELRRAALVASSARPGRPPVDADAPTAPAPRETLDIKQRALPTTNPVIPAVTTPKGRSTQPPGWVHAIVRKALAAEPAKRFGSMDDVVAALSRDRRRNRWIAAAIGVALGVGVIGGIMVMRRSDGCASGREPWSAARVQRVRAQLGSAPWTPTALAALGTFATGWEATYHAVCETRDAQSDRLLDLRMRCLDRALDRFDALASALEQPLEPAPRAEVAAAIGQLSRPETCATMTDPAELALPTDPARKQRAIAIEKRLDHAWTAYALGKYRDARDEATALQAEATGLDAAGLDAELTTFAATIEARVGEPAVARTQLTRALAAAAKANAHDLEYQIWTRMLRQELFAGTPAHVIEWEPFARAAALRAGLDGAELDGIVGEALRDAGQLEPARIALQRGLDSHDPLRGDQRALIEMNLGSVDLATGQPFLAQTAFERALELARTQLGDGHPTLAIYLDKLAEADRARGRIANALAHHDASVKLRTDAYGASDRSVATARFHRAETLVEAGQLARATVDLDAARSIRITVLGENSPRLGELEMVYGDIALAAGKPTEALLRYDIAAKLDPRLDLAARRAAAGSLGTEPVAVQPFTIERAPLVALWAIAHPARLQASDIYSAWRSARSEDPTLALATADALAATDTRRSDAVEVYRAALAALADEPSRMRLHALRALATHDPGSATAAATLAAQMPELVAPASAP